LGDDLAAGPLGLLIMPLMLIALASAVHLIRRYRASSGEERLQYRWVTWALAINVANIFAFTWTNELVSTIALGSIPVAFGIALTRYRLYNIDVVVSRTVTYGALAAFITGVYALVVVGVGSLVGSRDEPNLGLSVAAVALVAVVFEPLRSRLQRWANRLVYGERATPYEVLASATSRLAGSTTPEETLKTVSQLVVDGTGAAGAVLWIRVGEVLQPYSATPREAIAGLAAVPAPDDELPDLPGDASMPVRHRDDLLGALSIIKPRGQSVTGADEKVLADVAAGSGLLLRNISLNAELTERAAQLRASRRRLVAAHDAERHRLERDLHDGAQQQVVALKVKLGIARTLAEREGAADIATLASSLAEQVQQTVDAMRAVAHGIYPPLLEAEGLQAALTASARSAPIPVDVEADGLGRYPRDIEETAYFCVIDALEAARLSGAKGSRVGLTDREDRLTIEIDHDGRAATTNSQAITDRVEAFEGTSDIRVLEGTGSRTTINLPTPQPAKALA
jgi:signal transduction histidine kinase